MAPALVKLQEVPAPEPEPLLREILRAMAELHAREPNLHRLLFEEAPLAPELRRRITELEDVIAIEAAAWLRQRGTPGDPETMAWIIVQGVESLTHRWVISRGRGATTRRSSGMPRGCPLRTVLRPRLAEALAGG